MNVGILLVLRLYYGHGEGGKMSDITITYVQEHVSSLDAIGVDEGCSSSSTCTSLDISEVEFE
jgi:hypothetical protein